VRIRDHLRLALPEVRVDLAFLQIMSPSLEDVVADHAASRVIRVLIAPLFFGQGGHLKEDLPQLLAKLNAAHPDLLLRVTPAAGELDELVALLARWVIGEFQALSNHTDRTHPTQTG